MDKKKRERVHRKYTRKEGGARRSNKWKKKRRGLYLHQKKILPRIQVQAQELHSQYENDKTISSEIENGPTASKNIQELEKFTSDFFEATPPCSDEIVVDNNNLYETEANVVSNILPHRAEHIADKNAKTSEHPTMPSIHKAVVQVENPFVDVDRYKVKSETMPLVKDIFANIYKCLEVSKLMQLTPLELQSMLGQIGDLELVNVDVGWLQQLNQTSKARQLVKGLSTFKDVEARTILMIDKKKKAVETYEKELETCMASITMLQEKLMQEKEELVDVLSLDDHLKNFYEGKLVHGLI
ncbi:hypothetical protein Salat_0678900 [Sesamum alatum]|uniref:Uncharacterized protein n=1 Tax=Sesamum alatum TaxID=300844 RepID=A0AAE2CUK2_9LAMI|nr:hypothetical protein Salat_0678900 [Sesamum alatum]